MNQFDDLVCSLPWYGDITPPQQRGERPGRDVALLTMSSPTLTSARLNGITIRYASQGPTGPDVPLILFLHGWPESWYSYRHQLAALSAQGYLCVAPDMRGYGGTSAPKHKEDYNVYALAGDALALVRHLGYNSCLLVGHDWGAWLAWHLTLMYPDTFLATCAMSVPYAGRPDVGLLTFLRSRYGDSLDPAQRHTSNFHYMLLNNLPEAEAAYEANLRELLYRLYAFLPGVDVDSGTPEITDPRMFIDPARPHDNKKAKKKTKKAPGGGGGGGLVGGLVAVTERGAAAGEDDAAAAEKAATAATTASVASVASAAAAAATTRPADGKEAVGFWSRLPRPTHMPDWLSEEDLNMYVSEFQSAGFLGGLMHYRTPDLNWLLTPKLKGRKVQQPILFLAGDMDMVILAYAGEKNVRRVVTAACEQQPKMVFYPGKGHWIQQEEADAVNSELTSFFGGLPASLVARAKPASNVVAPPAVFSRL